MIRALAAAAFPRSDGWLWLAVAGLLPFGLLMVYSASLPEGPPRGLTPEAARQGLYALAGVLLMLAAARLDYRLLQGRAAAIYLGALLLLLAVLLAGVEQHGARRWLAVGPLTMQPAEFAKLALCIAFAGYAAARTPRLSALLATLGLAAVPAALVMLEPDLGTAIVLLGIWLVLLVAWGVPWRMLGGLLAVGAALGPAAFAIVPAYQRERLAVFLDPARDPLGSGFNLRQVDLALGTGGLTGHGLFSGAQSHLDSVAARSSDFMFGFVGAELGLLGGVALIALLACVVVRGLSVAARATDPFGRLLAAGLTAMVLTQGVVNIAMNLRMFPVTGIPLPFVSQGGSSLVAMLLAVGLLQSIAAHRGATAAGAKHAAAR